MLMSKIILTTDELICHNNLNCKSECKQVIGSYKDENYCGCSPTCAYNMREILVKINKDLFKYNYYAKIYSDHTHNFHNIKPTITLINIMSLCDFYEYMVNYWNTQVYATDTIADFMKDLKINIYDIFSCNDYFCCNNGGISISSLLKSYFTYIFETFIILNSFLPMPFLHLYDASFKKNTNGEKQQELNKFMEYNYYYDKSELVKIIKLLLESSNKENIEHNLFLIQNDVENENYNDYEKNRNFYDNT